MKTLVGLLFLSLLAASPAHARDGFDKVRCGGDIVKALVGQRADNEYVMVIEARHKNIRRRLCHPDNIRVTLHSIDA